MKSAQAQRRSFLFSPKPSSFQCTFLLDSKIKLKNSVIKHPLGEHYHHHDKSKLMSVNVSAAVSQTISRNMLKEYKHKNINAVLKKLQSRSCFQNHCPFCLVFYSTNVSHQFEKLLINLCRLIYKDGNIYWNTGIVGSLSTPCFCKILKRNS